MESPEVIGGPGVSSYGKNQSASLKIKAIIILLIILVSLIPVWMLYRYARVKMKARESMGRFLLFMLIMFAVIFSYTFLLVFLVRMIFPGA